MGDTSLIRTALLAALIAAFGLVAAESPAVACGSASWTFCGNAAISFPPP